MNASTGTCSKITTRMSATYATPPEYGLTLASKPSTISPSGKKTKTLFKL